ncbi:arsenite methyltransferase isoform X2 [Rhinichthys klamathensis goyatoka]|uniref:arsenite methyltransferase isoform X2 n=1 Tax=Rhinichthys klamathensis goyatoka TaxID=3034132 RepID=UPI0024B5B83B|nr:arsenite methyltransferase isoform X2 [Rhinichthys klamathensis goyatoka]
MADAPTAARYAVTSVYNEVKEYYGKTLKKTSDLKSNACVPSAKSVPAYVRKAIAGIHPDVVAKYYGCGLVVPECLEGFRVLDLGCGSGRDCYMLSQLVGEKGHVTGIDMTEDQLEVAQKYVDYHMQRFGYKKPNVNFVCGYIEALAEAGLEEKSYDIIISNCVVNLSPDKTSVLREAYRVLKDGGELYFSDVYSDARIPEDLKANNVLWGECLSGALWWEDLIRLAEEVGFCKPRLVTASIITVGNKELEKLLGDYKFVSATYRLFKLPKGSEKRSCLVMYNGDITGVEESFEFDAQFTFKVDKVMEVDGDVASLLSNSRFAEEFTFQPQEVNTSASGGCWAKPKAVSMNPFELVQQLGSARVTASTGGCCAGQESCCN